MDAAGKPRSGRHLRFAAALALGLVALAHAAPSAAAATIATFTVNRIGDGADRNIGNGICDTSTASGKQCSLRAAIQEANARVGQDIIKFNITSSSKVIGPGSPLPPITDAVQINGYSQSGTSQNSLGSGDDAVLKVVLDGINAGAHVNGLEIQGSNSVILGLVIQRFDGAGVAVSGTANAIYGNFIGTNPAGTLKRGNGSGVTVTGSGNFIGSFKPYTRNVISGNDSAGIVIVGNDNRVQGNHIGITKAGSAALGNGGDGVSVDDATGATIGGSSSGERNVISANGGHGVSLFVASGASGAVIQGNYIGTNAAGTADLGNALSGVYTDALSVQVGGTTPAARNVISGNGASGIALNGSDSNTIEGNLIGTKADGSGELGNDLDGILAQGFADDNIIGGTAAGTANVISGNDRSGIKLVDGLNNAIKGNVIKANSLGGITVSDVHDTISGNVIFANAADGIEVGGASTSGIRITGNQIYANGGLGIDLIGGTENSAAVTANDTADPDAGPNGLQNYPLLTSAVHAGNGLTTVTGTLNSTASTGLTIELFMAIADASAHGEGQVLLATQNVTTNASGNKTFTFQIANAAPGMVLTTTATTTTAGNTSEFGTNVTVTSSP